MNRLDFSDRFDDYFFLAPLAAAVMGRCGYGSRMPLLAISLYLRQHYVDHTVTYQASILPFIKDNLDLGRIDQEVAKSVAQGGSFDQIAGSLDGMCNFSRDEIGRHNRDQRTLILDPATGESLRR